jgi:rod shape determining protein RodA
MVRAQGPARRAVRFLDFPLLLATLALLSVGVLFIYSSGVSAAGDVLSNEWLKQIVWAVSGLGLLLLFAVTNHQRFKAYTPYLYAGTLLLLLLTALLGREVNGARSWLGVGEFGIQPSEFAKILTILFLAAYLSEIGIGIRELPRFLLALAIVAAPVGLIALQPDLGTALVYPPVFLIMALIAGARPRHLMFVVLVGVAIAVLGTLPAIQQHLLGRDPGLWRVLSEPAMAPYTLMVLLAAAVLSALGYRAFRRSYFYWMMYGSSALVLGVAGGLVLGAFLQDYQVMRLVIFINPWIDPRGAGWNIIQSVTAVGAGGFSGAGFLAGTQSHLRFLPQQSTDFIFSIIGEEWGFLGGILVLALFATIIGRGIIIFYSARDDFATLVGAGIVAIFFFHAFVNMGMAMGIMPITGIPLPFLSYGGSSVWTGMIAVGLLANIGLARSKGA